MPKSERPAPRWQQGLDGRWMKVCERCRFVNVTEATGKQPPAAYPCRECDRRRIERERRARENADAQRAKLAADLAKRRA